MAPEYPGYGTYKQTARRTPDEKVQSIQCTSQQIREDAECIYDFVLANFANLEEADILLFGRSMGSGPVVHLAAKRSPGAVVLMSAYTSIKKVVYEKFSFFSALVNEQFDNLSLCKDIQSPTLLIHGLKDELIGPGHSQKLHEELTNCPSVVILPKEMTHNGFDFYKDLIKPLLTFIEEHCSSPVEYTFDEDLLISISDIFFVDQDFERLKRRERMKLQGHQNQKQDLKA